MKRKRIVIVIVIALIVGLGVSIPIYINYINNAQALLVEEEIVVSVGDKLSLSKNSKEESKKYKWQSSDENVVIVNEYGEIEAIGEGTVVVRVNHGDKVEECKITVKGVESSIQTESVDLKETNKTIKVGEEFELEYTIKPENATSKTVTFYSSNEKVATVADGKVVGVGIGEAVVSVVTVDGNVAFCNVVVTEGDEEIEDVGTVLDNTQVEVESIKFNANDITINLGESYNLGYVINPSDAVTNVIWNSSDNKIVSISGDGMLYGRSSGVVTITAYTLNGKKTTATIEVVNPVIEVSDISLNKKDANIVIGDTLQLSALILPDNASNKSVVWSSSDSAIASVNTKGLVKAKKEGIVTITAKTKNGKTGKATINVVKKEVAVSQIKLDKTTATINVDEVIQLREIYSPTNATNTNVKWTSSDKTIAKVDNKGLVTGVDVGNVTISAETENGKIATANITVVRPVNSIALSKATIGLNVGESYTLNATIYPTNATDKDITWSSNNTSIATVSNKGVIKGVKAGTAKITAKTSNGKSVTATVTVSNINLNSITLDTKSKTMTIGDVWKVNAILSPSNVTNKKVTWKSGTPEVVTVNADGLITAVSGGVSTITATSNGKSVSIKITVQNPNLIVDNSNFLKVSGQKIVRSKSNVAVTLRGFNLGIYLSRSTAFMPIEPLASSAKELANKGYSCINSESILQALEKNPKIISRSQKTGRSPALQAQDLSYILYDNYITGQDYDLIAQTGANVIRLPFEYTLFLYENPKNGLFSYSETRAKEAFKRIDKVINECKKRGIYVILDFHLAPGRQNNGGWCGTGQFFNSANPNRSNYQGAVKTMWGKIAARYKEEETVAGYDLLNEPETGTATLVSFYDTIYKEIRYYDKNHIIFMEETCVFCGYNTKATKSNYMDVGVGKLPCPSEKGWTNVVYSTHDYVYDLQDKDGDGRKTDIDLTTSTDKLWTRINTKVANTKLKSGICNVPYYIGEFSHLGSYESGAANYKNYLPVWEKAMDLYEQQNLSYTPWTYKGNNDRYYGLVFYSSLDKVNIEKDSYDEIKTLFSKNSSQSMRFNNQYYEMFVDQWGGRYVKNIKLSSNAVTLKVGENTTVNYEVTPNTAIRKKVTWTSDDKNNKVIKVDKATGKITAVGKGTAKVTATVTPLILNDEDKDQTATATITVTVK